MCTANEPASSALRSDLQQVWKVAGVIAFGLSVLSLGIPVLVAKITKELGPALDIWYALAATAPLTASVALIGTGVLRGWFDSIWTFLLATAATLAGTAGIGHLLGLAGWIDFEKFWRQSPKSPFALVPLLIGTFLENYWKIYGVQQFCSSLLVGGFLAWAWGLKILPHLTSPPQLFPGLTIPLNGGITGQPASPRKDS